MEYAQEEKWYAYADIRHDMAVLLIDEKRFLDSFLMLAESFLYSLNGDNIPYISDRRIQFAQRLHEFVGMPRKTLSPLIVERLKPLYTPYHFYTIQQVADIFLFNAYGMRDQANKIFCKYCPDIRSWLKKLRRENDLYLAAQDCQLKKVISAEARYKETGDLEWYVDFWEKIWANGGLLFGSSKWWFVLPDLYFKQKRFDDVISFCEMLKVRDKYATDKADKYIERAEERKAKAKAKKK